MRESSEPGEQRRDTNRSVLADQWRLGGGLPPRSDQRHLGGARVGSGKTRQRHVRAGRALPSPAGQKST